MINSPTGSRPGSCCTGRTAYQLDDRISAVPIAALWGRASR
ncbi:MAG TPA: hypothetical protein VFG15_31380 [Amycolatopsis sp.]|nr:hypothetical protein [Amycolatopsis sp.]